MRRAVEALERAATGLVGTIGVVALIIVIIWCARGYHLRPSGPTPAAPVAEGETRGPQWGDDEMVEPVPGDGSRVPYREVKAAGDAPRWPTR